MSKPRAAAHDRLFYSVLPFEDTSQVSFPLLEKEQLSLAVSRKAVLVLGTSRRVRQRLAGALDILRAAAASFTDIPLTTADLAAGKGHAVLDSLGGDPFILLAEEDYGPAFTRLCGLLRAPAPVLLPSGYVLAGIPGAAYAGRESAAISNGNLHAWLAGKNVLLWSPAENPAFALRHELAARGKDIAIAAWIDPESAGRESGPAGTDAIPPGRMGSCRYDAILVADHPYRAFAYRQLFGAPPEGTPVFLEQPGGEFLVTQANPLFAAKGYFLKPRKMSFFFSKEQFRELSGKAPETADALYGEIRTIGNCKYDRKSRVHTDVATPGYTVASGKRGTLHTNARCDHTLFILGSSVAHGYFCTDGETIASYLQRACNEHSPAGGPVYTVCNHGVANSSSANMYSVLKNIPLARGDAVLLVCHPEDDIDAMASIRDHCARNGAHFALFSMPHLYDVRNPSRYERKLLRLFRLYDGFLYTDTRIAAHATRRRTLDAKMKAHGIPAYALSPCFSRPHALGEVFFDHLHVTARGNHRIARAIHAEYVRYLGTAGKENADAWADKEFLESVRHDILKDDAIAAWVQKTRDDSFAGAGAIGAIVMNCNPFTLGHLHIIRTALSRVDRLYIFLVEEDGSFFSYADRAAMVLQGTAGFGDRVRVAPSGKYIISSATFPEYFMKEAVRYTPDVSLEIAIFGTVIAPALRIGTRFFGEEPNCAVTRAYHEQIKELLPACGIRWEEIPRITDGSGVISASRVREHFGKGELEALSALVPVTTFRHLLRLYRSGKPAAKNGNGRP